MGEVINVVMYGGKCIFGGRETKKVAAVSTCDFANDCPALKAGRCAAHNPRMYECINLRTSYQQGYTSRAMKYHDFVNKWRGHEKYGMVKKSLKNFEHIGGGLIRIELPHIDIDRGLSGDFGYSAMGAKNIGYIEIDDFNVEKLKNIMASYSLPLMGGGRLDSSENKERMLLDIKEIDFELYDAFVKETGIEINYVGMEAYLKTLRGGITLKNGWLWNGEKMKKESRDSVDCSVIKGFVYGCDISFKPDDDTLVEVEYNDWVTSGTKFK